LNRIPKYFFEAVGIARFASRSQDRLPFPVFGWRARGQGSAFPCGQLLQRDSVVRMGRL